MVCSKCGIDNNKNSAFCTACGTPLVTDTSNNNQTNPIKKKSNKNLTGIIIAAAAALLILISVIIIIAIQPKKVNVEEFIEISYSGYDGYATASASLDRDGLHGAILEKKGNKKDNDNDAFDLAAHTKRLQEAYELEELIRTIRLEIQPNENLSNGDEIVVDIYYDNETAKKHKIRFTGERIKQEVEALSAILEMDPFENLTVSFSGISPAGYLEYEYTGDNDYISSYSFEIDKSSDLRNGDKVIFSINYMDEDTVRNGYVFTVKEKEYEVAGLQEYVGSFADIPSEFIETLKQESEDSILSYTANDYSDKTSLGEISYAGYVFNSIKPDVEYPNDYNNLFIIYSGTVSNTEGKISPTKVYFPVRFTNILNDGTDFSYSENYGVRGSSNFGNSWYKTKGYINPLTAYMDIVEANRDTYVSESGDGFEGYAEYESISTISDISDDYRNKLAAEAKDVIESYIAEDYSETSHATNLVLKGEYLLVSKNQGTDFGSNNRYVIVYSATISNDDGKFETTEVYFPVGYEGIVSLPNDEYMFTVYEGILGSTSIGSSWYTTKGYIDGVDMFKKIITANRESYTYEVSEGLKEFGK